MIVNIEITQMLKGSGTTMLFSEISFQSIPVITHACNADFRSYKNFFPNHYSDNLLEISVCIEGRVVRNYRNKLTEIIGPGILMPIFKDDHFNSYAYQNERHRHISIGVKMDYDIQHWDSAQITDLDALKKRVEESGHILIPCCAQMGGNLDELTHMMQKLIYTYTSHSAVSRTQALAEWFCIAAFLTSIVLKELGVISAKHSPAAERYVQKATTYIQSYYTQKLTLEDVANHIGISAGHLSRIFREVQGVSILDYINQFRISTLMRFAEIHHLTLKEAAYLVGFDDPSYVSRLFKKTTGMTYRQFLAQCQEKKDA